MLSPLTAYLWSFWLAFGQAWQVMGIAASSHSSRGAPGPSSPPSQPLPPCLCKAGHWGGAGWWRKPQAAPLPWGWWWLWCLIHPSGHLFWSPFKKGNLKVNFPHISFKLVLSPCLYYSISISKTNETVRKSYSQCKCEFENVPIWASRNAWTFLLWEQSDLWKEMDLSFCFVLLNNL